VFKKLLLFNDRLVYFVLLSFVYRHASTFELRSTRMYYHHNVNLERVYLRK
jgi:hypothetical protein